MTSHVSHGGHLVFIQQMKQGFRWFARRLCGLPFKIKEIIPFATSFGCFFDVLWLSYVKHAVRISFE